MSDINMVDGFLRYDGNNSFVMSKNSRKNLRYVLQRKFKTLPNSTFAVSVQHEGIMLVPVDKYFNGKDFSGFWDKLRQLDNFILNKLKEEDERLMQILGINQKK